MTRVSTIITVQFIVCVGIFIFLFSQLTYIYTDESELSETPHCFIPMKIRITAVRKASYPDLMAKYENPIEHTCDVLEGQEWISVDGKCPEGMCPSAWGSMREFVEALARGEGNFFDGWMKNPKSAMISCNDGFRPVSFYIEVI